MKQTDLLARCLSTVIVLGLLCGVGASAGQELAAGGAELSQAMQSLQEGDLAQALEILEALVRGPSPPMAAYGILGGLYVERGDAELAMPLLQRVIDAGEGNAAVLFNAGRAAMQTGDPERGEQFLREAARLAPASPAARALGILYGRRGRPEEAYVILRPWVRDNPDDVEARLAAALGAVELQRIPEAEELLASLPQEDPGVQLLWGRALLIKGEHWGAIGFLEPLLRDAPETLQRDARRLLADAYLRAGEASEAVGVLEQGSLDDPRSVLLLAQSHYRNGEPGRSVTTLEALASQALDPQAPLPTEVRADVLVAHGQHLAGLARHAEAVEFLEAGTRLAPADKAGWQSLGQAYAAAGQRDRAQAALQRFQEIADSEEEESVNRAERDLADPTGRELRQAMRLLETGEGERAIALLRRELELADGDPRPGLFLSRAYLLLGQPSEALVAAQAVLASSPDNVDARYSVATAQMGLDLVDEAETGLRAVLEAQPDFTPAMSDLAVLLARRGDATEARRLLERVLELRPGDPVATQALAQLDAG